MEDREKQHRETIERLQMQVKRRLFLKSRVICFNEVSHVSILITSNGLSQLGHSERTEPDPQMKNESVESSATGKHLDKDEKRTTKFFLF